MTKRDFELIAMVISRLELPRNIRAYIIAAFSLALAVGNPRFNGAKFVKACKQKESDNAQDTEL